MHDTPVSAILTPVTSTRAPEAVVRSIKDAILRGELQPGQKLPPEAQLARMLGVATMTLRQGLAVLKEFGLIESRRGRNGGTFVHPEAAHQAGPRRVSPLTLSDLRDLTDWRKAISGEAATLAAARSTKETLASLVDAAKKCESLINDPEHYRRADADLHILISELSGSLRLRQAEASIQQEINELFLNTTDIPKLRRIVRHSHADLVEAIVRKRPDEARQAMRQHAESTYDWLVELNIFPDA